jgi:hypothetical protein
MGWPENWGQVEFSIAHQTRNPRIALGFFVLAAALVDDTLTRLRPALRFMT